MDVSVNKLLAVITVISILLGGGIGWGLLQARVDGVIRDNERLRATVSELREDKVSKDAFNDVITDLKAGNTIIREDIKKILQRLPERN